MKKGKYILLAVGIVFLVPLVILFVKLNNHQRYLNLINNGIEATAEVIDYYSNETINDVDYYYLVYQFKDDEGITHQGKTSSSYELHEAMNIKTITIKYDKHSFKSIQADYSAKNIGVWIWLLTCFSLVGVIIIIAFVVIVVKEKQANKIMKFGRSGIATFVRATSGVVVNGVYYYRIEYDFVDDMGRNRREKSGSNYTYEEARFFELIKQFEIKYIDKKSVISHKIDLSKIYDTIDNKETEQLITCQYCGKPMSANLDRCPNCNSKIK